MYKMENKIKSQKDATNYITRNGRKHGKIKIKLYGEEIEHVTEAKLLGVTITKTMNYGQHIDIAIAKSNRRIHLLKLLSGTDWGCNPKTIMRIYKTYVRPVLEYGAIVMLSAAQVHFRKTTKNFKIKHYE